MPFAAISHKTRDDRYTSHRSPETIVVFCGITVISGRFGNVRFGTHARLQYNQPDNEPARLAHECLRHLRTGKSKLQSP